MNFELPLVTGSRSANQQISVTRETEWQHTPPLHPILIPPQRC